MDAAGEIGVLLQQLLFGGVVVVGLGLLERRRRFWPIITNVDRKIASSETTRVNVGHGLFSNTTIHTANARRGGRRTSCARELGYRVGDPELDVLGAVLALLDDDRMVFDVAGRA